MVIAGEWLGFGTLGVDVSAEAAFMVKSCDILFSLALIPFTLRMMRWQWARKAINGGGLTAYARLAALRLTLLAAPLLGNIALYYLLTDPSFAYLSVITALCFAMVCPTKGKCVYEFGGAKEQ